MKKLVYILGDNSIIEEETGDVVIYGDDVTPEVLSNVVNIYNQGKSISEIDQYLLDEELCTQDEREFIIENINNYISMENQNQNNQFPNNLDQIIPGFATELGTPAPVEPVVMTGTFINPEPVKKKNYQRRMTDGKSTAFKPQSTDDFIKVMQEKIEMARMLDAVVLPEISGSMTKGNRDIMVEFQKEHAAMVVKYMQKIQQA